MKTVNSQHLQTSFYSLCANVTRILSLFLTKKILMKQEVANLVQIAAQFGSAMDEYVDKVVRS